MNCNWVWKVVRESGWVCLLTLTLLFSTNARAAVTITAASGGNAISADTAASGGSGAWTSLGAITISEVLTTDISRGTNVTLVLKCPAGFEFRTNITPSITFTGSRDVRAAAITVNDPATVTVTLTISGTANFDTITIGSTTALQVRPLAGTPLPASRHLYRPTTGGGSCTVAGITTSADGSSGSNFGTLAEVAGAPSRLIVTLPNQTFNVGTGNSGTVVTQTSGTAFTITRLTAIDQFTNIATSYSGTRTIAYAGPGGNPTYTTSVGFTAGQSTTTLTTTLRRAELTTITATSTGITGVASSPLLVQPAAFSRLQLLVPGESASPGSTTGKTGTPTAQSVGAAFSVSVNAVDANWNPITNVTDTVGITSSDPNAILPANTALSGGTQTFPVTFRSAGGRTLTASDITNAARTNNTSPTITVNASAFTQLQILLPGETAAPGTASGKTGTPTAQTAGTAFTATVNAVDASWNVITNATGTNYTIHITSSDANALLPANNDLASGTRAFSVTLRTAGTATITSSDVDDATKTPSTSAPVTVRAGAFNRLQLLAPGEVAAPGTTTGKTGTPMVQATNVAFTVTVNGVDTNWNVISTNDTIHPTSSDAAAILPTNAPLVAGTRNFNITLRTISTNITITASNLTHTGITRSVSPALTVVGTVPLRGGPVVAIHDSESTRALELTNAAATTPSGAGTTGREWWPTNWHYFVMPESIKEALRSDGTAFEVVTDADIAAGRLLDTNGRPKYPIVISLASEAIRNDEIAPLTNYVAAGGFLLTGSSAFTRNTNGTTRGDFAFANEMGIHMVVPGLTNWRASGIFNKQREHRLMDHIPGGALNWEMPTSSESIPWGIYPHPNNPLPTSPSWQVQAGDATVLATDNVYPSLLDKQFGHGHFIYYSPMQPLVGHGGYAPGMYAYVMFRKAIEWAFESSRLPVPKLSPWPYPYDAALTVRHDLENLQNEIAGIEASAQVEFTNGVKGDYFFCTGTLRQDMSPAYDTNAVVASIRRAISNYNAVIGPHNGGLRNPYNNPPLTNTDYDFWHWGPDEALDITPAGYASGKAYALASMSNSFLDIERWLPGQMTNGMRVWVAPYFDATRENSYDIQAQLGVKAAGEQKLTPFPHWTLSTTNSGKLYSFVSIPVSDWFVGNTVAQSLEAGHTTASVHAAIDFYYGLGALINLYSHTLSSGVGPSGALETESVIYSANTNLHPRLWAANSIGLYNWWLARSNAQTIPTFTSSGEQATLTLAISGSTDTNTAVEALLPGTASSLQVLTNGVLASGASYRTNGQLVRVRVGTTVTNVQLQYFLLPRAVDDAYSVTAAGVLSVPGPGVLANDTPGLAGTNLTAVLVSNVSHGTLTFTNNGGFNYVPATNYSGIDSFTYRVSDGVSNSAAATVTISVLPPGTLFLDDFSRGTEPGSLLPWIVHSGNWSVTGGQLRSGPQGLQTYAFAYVPNTWSNYSVEARLQFPAGGLGGGLGGRLNPTTGAHYAAWVYPEGSPGGSSVLKLIKWQSWTDFGYNGNSGAVMQQASLPGVGTNFHNVRLAMRDNQITVYYDGVQVISTTDVEAQPYTSGGICLDLGTDAVAYTLLADDVKVLQLFPVPTANSDTYTVQAGATLTVAAPGVLSNDTSPGGALSAVVAAAPTHGNLNLNTNGGFTYTPATNFAGIDSFSYQAVDPATNSATGTVIISVLPAGTLFYDDFARDVDNGPLTPWTTRSGNWTIGGGAMQSGGNTAQSYAFSFLSNNWGNVAVEARIRFSAGGFGGGIGGRLNPTTGSHYAAWVYPEGSPGGSSVLRLIKFQTWTTFGYNGASGVPMQEVSLPGVGTNWHSVKLGFHERQIAVYYDGVQVLSMADAEAAPYTSGGMSFDMWTDSTAYTMSIDEAVVKPLVVDDSYAANEDTLLTVPASGVSSNDTSVYTPTPVALVVNAPLHGVLNLGTNGGFTYQPATNYNGSDSFSYQLIDGTTNLGTATVALNVVPVNDAPLLPAQADRTIAELTSLFVTNAATDVDSPANALTYSLLAAPAGAVISTNGIISWTPSEAQGPSTNTFTTVVTDNGQQASSATNSFNVVVTEANSAPLLSGQSPRTIAELSLLVVTNAASDTDIPANDLSYTLVNPPAGAVIDAAGVITWTPSEAQGPSTNTITTVVTDNGQPALSATNSFTVVVIEINSAPVLADQSSRTVAELTTLTVTNTATDADIPANILSYALVNPPSGAAIDAAGVITWTPSEAQGPSINTITTIVTDDGVPARSATNSFEVVVTEVNTAPVLTAQTNQTIAELATLVITNTATDLDVPANILSYILLDAPAGATIDTNGVITWTPDEAQGPSTNTITTVVTDNGSPSLSATNSFEVVVLELNTPPLLPTQFARTIAELTMLVVTNTAGDSDIPANHLSYVLVDPPSGAVIDSEGVITWTPSEAQGPSTNTITTIVTDDGVPALSATNSFEVVVTEVNSAPVLTLQTNRTVAELTTIAITNTATDSDIPHNVLSYFLVNAPEGATIDAEGIITWTPSEAQGPSTNTITTVVTDNGFPSLSATNSFEIVVLEVNTAPILPVQNDRTLGEFDSLTVTNTATDNDLPANVLTYSLLEAPVGAVIDSQGVITWTPTEAQRPSTNLFTTKVIDDGIAPLSATNTFTVIVAAPTPAPTIQSIVLSGEVSTITWIAVPGRNNRLQYKTNLEDTAWTDLSPDIAAIAATASSTDNIAGVDQRFYRVVLLP
jgi:hypothetical protein